MPANSRVASSALVPLGVAAVILAIGPPGARAVSPPVSPETRSASFESSLDDSALFDWRVDQPFQVSRTDEVGGADGAYAAKIVTRGGNPGCSCSRVTPSDGVGYGAGDDVWIGGSWYVREPSKLKWSDLMNLGHWGSPGDPDNWALGLGTRGSGMSVRARGLGTGEGSVLLPERPIPADRWFSVDLHLVLSPRDGEALTEWYVDDRLVGSTTKANMLREAPLNFYNAGLSYFWPGNGDTTVYFDAARLTQIDQPDPEPPPFEARSASFESGLNAGSDFGWRVEWPFSVTRTTEAGAPFGSYAAKIVTNGGNAGCSCPRMTFQDGFSFGPGDEVWIGGSWRIPDPSKLAWSRLMNMGHYETSGDPDNWMLALLVRDAGEMMVAARHYKTDQGQSVLMPPQAIPKGRWFGVDLHLKLSPIDGQALTEVFLDGRLITTTTKRNMVSGQPLQFYNAGLSHFWPGGGNTTVYFDGPRLVY